MVRLENWYIVYQKDFYSAPESTPSMVVGKCYGHPKYPDGTLISTSKFISHDKGVFRTIKGTEYVLGEVSKEYESLFPNAYARITIVVENFGTKVLV